MNAPIKTLSQLNVNLIYIGILILDIFKMRKEKQIANLAKKDGTAQKLELPHARNVHKDISVSYQELNLNLANHLYRILIMDIIKIKKGKQVA